MELNLVIDTHNPIRKLLERFYHGFHFWRMCSSSGAKIHDVFSGTCYQTVKVLMKTSHEYKL